ncbi:MAG: ABC-type nickel/cobalt efflux system permease component RcnA [Myxococcota bacterium]|jgi:ABC-type nickel/cobalt efflux system permease component RcnA
MRLGLIRQRRGANWMLAATLALAVLLGGGPSLVVCHASDGTLSLEAVHSDNDHHHEAVEDGHDHAHHDHDHHDHDLAVHEQQWLGHDHGCADRTLDPGSLFERSRTVLAVPLPMVRRLPAVDASSTAASLVWPVQADRLPTGYHVRSVVLLI